MSSLTGPYSACFFRMSNAYAAWESLCFMYLICSWYLCLRRWLVCPMYDNLLVLHWSIWIPLLSCSCVLLTIFAFVSYCKVLVFLKDIPTSVCLSKLVIFYWPAICECCPCFFLLLICSWLVCLFHAGFISLLTYRRGHYIKPAFICERGVRDFPKHPFLNQTVYIIRLTCLIHSTRTPLPFSFRTLVPSLYSSLDITAFLFRSVLLQNYSVFRHFVQHFRGRIGNLISLKPTVIL